MIKKFFAGVLVAGLLLSGCGNNESDDANKPQAEVKTEPQKDNELLQAAKEGASQNNQTVTQDPLANNPHWIKDIDNGAYLWNPEPQDGESVRWSGGTIYDGNILYVHGFGTLTWYREGQVIQTDVGSFDHGRHHGQFKHTFKSGNVDYSNWDHGQEIAEPALADSHHWIKDLNNGAYVWNPEPQDGESVRWSGGVVRIGNNLYAHGFGTLTWYKYGQAVQWDEGTFERGRHHGQFKHTFKSGNVDYSNWDHGREI